MKAANLVVDALQEVMTQDNVNMPGTDWPPRHSHLILDGIQHLDVRTWPVPRGIVPKSILGPPVVALLGQPDIELQLCSIEKLLKRLEAKD